MAFEDDLALLEDKLDRDTVDLQVKTDKEIAVHVLNEGLEKAQAKKDLTAKSISAFDYDKKIDQITYDYNLKQSEAKRKGARDLIILKRKYKNDKRLLVTKELEREEPTTPQTPITTPIASVQLIPDKFSLNVGDEVKLNFTTQGITASRLRIVVNDVSSGVWLLPQNLSVANQVRRSQGFPGATKLAIEIEDASGKLYKSNDVNVVWI